MAFPSRPWRTNTLARLIVESLTTGDHCSLGFGRWRACPSRRLQPALQASLWPRARTGYRDRKPLDRRAARLADPGADRAAALWSRPGAGETLDWRGVARSLLPVLRVRHFAGQF